ncbi:MAG: DMT family transporter [Candidatus Cloacimonetes bacterium]|nr:DMT family transporter [Candidatus Cloacimonadota bacterium]
MSKQNIAYIFAGLSILCWSSISTAFKLSLRYLTPIGLLFIASFVATLFLGISLLVTDKNKLSKQATPKAFFKNLKQSLLSGLLNPFLYYLMLFEAYSKLRAQEAQALNYTWAIVLAMFSIILLKEKFRIIDLFSLLLSFAGVLIISTKGQLSTLRFDNLNASILALSTSIIWAMYWIISIKDTRPALQKLFFNFLVGFLLISIYILVLRAKLLILGTSLMLAFWGGVYVGIFEMGLTFYLWLKALEYTENTATISNLIFLTPFISLLFIAQLLHESIQTATIWGLCLIVLSNFIQKGFFRHSKR